ncbi:uncharacterized protein LOC6528580 [Drosophila yakuba]|uniref:Uncharacterized protein n=1 Tax=Drosophila yakuba TaxID=7245 RepID=B4P2S4_DROYA|nr:uncharacterized protein LOC6528580 [Drosophila yakuba]EDW89335.1 uncharacterized protein Dyak_GE23064 [Drosophila yakuba]
MLRMLRQKCRSLVDRSMPCLESLVNACSLFKADWSEDLSHIKPSADCAGSSVLRQHLVRRNYSSQSSADNCGLPKECEQESSTSSSKGCGPARFKGTICDAAKGGKRKKKEEPKKKSNKPKLSARMRSMWYIPDCEYEPKCDMPVRYDIQHYRISDKDARQYQVTWNECPRMVIKPKKVCIHSKRPRPKPCRRQRKTVVATARPSMPMLNPMECKKPEDSSPCPRWTLPCCKPARIPPSCHRERRPTDCTKRPAPYPSFSECKREELTKAPPTECLCLKVPMVCEMWAELRRRIARGKGAVLKCGEM